MITEQTNAVIEKHILPQSGAVALRFVPQNGDAPPNAPTVFVLHGLGSAKERQLDLCLRLVRAGFAAVAVDAALHGERTREQSRDLSDFSHPGFVPAFTHVVRQTVADLAAFASEWGLPNYGLIGHSMGGFIALHTALADARARAVVVVGGALDATLAGADDDPVRRARELAGRAVLLLHGVNDDVVPIYGARNLHAALLPHYAGDTAPRLSLVELEGVGHEWTPGIADASVAWMTQFLPGTP